MQHTPVYALMGKARTNNMAVMMQAFYWDASVKTRWPNQKFAPIAWDGHDETHPNERTTDGEGNAEFPAPPRGYAIYVPV